MTLYVLSTLEVAQQYLSAGAAVAFGSMMVEVNAVVLTQRV